MTEIERARESSKPLFTFAAWFSLIAPLLASVLIFFFGRLPSGPPERMGSRHERQQHTKFVFGALALASALGLASGVVSLWGIRTNSAIVILPPALLGILMSVALEAFALFFYVLADLPGP